VQLGLPVSLKVPGGHATHDNEELLPWFGFAVPEGQSLQNKFACLSE
jgi:hypothetical protein